MAEQPEAMRDAVEAVKGGHVHLDGQRTKPGREIHRGSRLHITKGAYEWEIEVLVLAKQRRPAAEAVHFYRESEDSHARRQRQVAEHRAAREAMPLHTTGRPSKRDRRLIHRFKQSREDS
jgi:ribosome-associated heat shock protein Hsp15